MGEFGGNIGMFEFNNSKFNFKICSFGNAKYVLTLIFFSIFLTIYNFFYFFIQFFYQNKKLKLN